MRQRRHQISLDWPIGWRSSTRVRVDNRRRCMARRHTRGVAKDDQVKEIKLDYKIEDRYSDTKKFNNWVLCN